MSKQPASSAPAKAPVQRRTLPADLAAAGKIDQILEALSIDDAEIVLERANRLFAKRKAAVASPAFAPEAKE